MYHERGWKSADIQIVFVEERARKEEGEGLRNCIDLYVLIISNINNTLAFAFQIIFTAFFYKTADFRAVLVFRGNCFFFIKL
jgi:hypothetical protein